MNIKRILVADGNARDRQILSDWLSAQGYEVVVAADGAETVNTVRSHPPDLVLLNTSFPPDVAHGGGAFVDGFLIIDWLRRLKENEAIPFLMITDDAAAKLQDKARASGAKGLFQKPFDPEALLSVIQRILDSAPPQPE
jgi:CheY-like chemotaxis protein